MVHELGSSPCNYCPSVGAASSPAEVAGEVPDIDGRSLGDADAGGRLLGGERLLADDVVDIDEDRLERLLDVERLERRGLQEGQRFLLGQDLGGLGGYRPEVVEVQLVPRQHDDDVRVGVVPQLAQPSLDVVEGLALGYVVDEEGSDRASVVGARDGSVPLLPGSVPYLRLHRLSLYLHQNNRTVTPIRNIDKL